jgi:hypothetical protein
MIHQTARLRCFVSAGEMFVHEDGTFEIAPLSLWRRKGGGFIFRVGRSTYWFDQNGEYDGPEFKLDRDVMTPERQAGFMDALKSCPDNRNHAPADAYFHVEADGWKDETALWPAEDRAKAKFVGAAARPAEQVYEVAATKGRSEHVCLVTQVHDANSGLDVMAVQPTAIGTAALTLATGEKVAVAVVSHGDQAVAFLLDGEHARQLRDALDTYIPNLTPIVSRPDPRH